MEKISVIDYGCGNLASVINMIQHVGGEAQIIKSPAQLTEASKLVLPGVGAFDHGMNNLRDGGWVAPLEQAVFERRVPLMGICLGMQLLTHGSEEGQAQGLGWIDARVRRFRVAHAGLKVPHMGWSEVLQTRPDLLLPPSADKARFYFVHSYKVECNDADDVLLQCEYGETFVAAFHRANIWGFQFHPEKSHRFGMALFRNFLEI
ncbi:imidazole glycerol phosphate synthase subunit HisH [Comamonas sp.]|uniref:imidazole glycerol phosphate synthase subunit HisH n=1 Tax=Comamonas sp. TaxID=34028 RepID=UPI0026496209|nr:imidazole glycerol phosphate synthase subunit HisH [Comamonas sp.]MDN5537301.1 imidazole glycerol phosphate synthase subunit HisH [Comamonas sp.]